MDERLMKLDGEREAALMQLEWIDEQLAQAPDIGSLRGEAQLREDERQANLRADRRFWQEEEQRLTALLKSEGWE